MGKAWVWTPTWSALLDFGGFNPEAANRGVHAGVVHGITSCILVGIYCHNIPTRTPQSGYHGVTEVAKTANIAKMAEKCINCISARPTLSHTNPMESGPGNTFSAQNRKKPKDLTIHCFMRDYLVLR